MVHASTVWNRTALALVLALAAVNVYRAATQSITIDEAFTYNCFVAAPAAEAVRYYDANNHVAHSLLMWISTTAFGLSEFTVRLPSLLGGALYLFSAWRLCGYAFGGSWFMLLGVAMLGLNPFVLDYLSAARGYALALGFLLFALDQMVRYTADARRGRLYAAGAALGLAVASNLVFAVPGVALSLAFACLVYGAAPFRSWLGITRELVDHLALPAIVTAFVIMVVPLSHAETGAYYYGAESLVKAVRSLGEASFGVPVSGGPVWAALLAAMAAAAFAMALRRGKPPQPTAALAGGTTVFSLAALVMAHHAGGVPYPMDRTGIYWVPLFVLVGFGLARRRAARIAVAAVSALCLMQFVLLFRVSHYGAWRDDAGVNRMVAVLRGRETGARRVRVTGSWRLEPSLNFYRRMYRLDWMEPVDRGLPDAPGHYRALTPEDAGVAERLGLRVIYRDPVSGAVLAE